MGLGSGTNNFIELMALKLLLLFVGEKEIRTIQIFGDSMTVLNWIWKIQKCHNILSLPLLEEVTRFLDSFDSFSVKHVYRERNFEANSLSKVTTQITFGHWLISETKGKESYDFYHRHFIEGMSSIDL